MKTGEAGSSKKTRRPAQPADPAPEAPSSRSEARAGYVSLCSRSRSSESKPIFFSSHPVGDALLATGIPRMAGAAVNAMGVFLPLGLSGLDVRETLHRFDANPYQPTTERGLLATNRTGEALGQLTMRWLLAPDGFEATPGAQPPPTQIAAGVSQRVVLRDGVIMFDDRGRGTLRFFGAGRTYPATTDGQARLMFAGTAVIVEGTGSLKGVRGTLMLSGEVTPPSGLALNIVGHFDTGGPVEVEDTLGPLVDVPGDAPATMFTFLGESGADLVERTRVARLGNDLANATRLRSYLRVGARAGAASGPLPFDSDDRQCSVPLGHASRVLSFADLSARPIGTITASALEGTAFREVRDGRVITRIVGYGAASAGTGALAGAGGVLTFEAAVDGAGQISTLYALRLADPSGRFRAPFSDAFKPTPVAAQGPPPAASLASLHFVDDDGAISDEDRTIVRHADRTMGDGIELLRWWEDKDRAGDFGERLDLVREFNAGNRNYSFLDTATVNNARLPVMGIVQEMFYDRPKGGSGTHVRDQLREFVMRYFLRTSHVRQPDFAPEGGRGPLSVFETVMTWLPWDGEHRTGMRFQQLYYKLKESGRIGKFTKAQRPAIVDLREIGETYDWIVLKCDIFNFNLSFSPLGADSPKMMMPLKETTYLVLGQGFVRHAENPEPGVVGRYGLCYAFLPYPPPDGPKVVAYGPGHFAAAIQTFDFTMKDDGEIRVNAAFVVSRPNKIAKIDVAPLDWTLQVADMLTLGMASRLMSPVKAMADRLPLRVEGVDPIETYIWLANTMTGGLAAKRFGISKLSLEKRMLVQHFMQHYEMLNTSLFAWRMVGDWTDADQVPTFAKEGAA